MPFNNLETPKRFFVILGPPGSGKTTIAKRLSAHCGPHLQTVISITTRKPRDSDNEDEYRYVSSEQFAVYEDNDAFAWTETHNNARFGTLRRHLDARLRPNAPVGLLILTPQRTNTLRELYGAHNVFALYIWAPESLRIKRLMQRDGMTREDAERRVHEARDWDNQVAGLRPTPKNPHPRDVQVPVDFALDNEGNLERSVETAIRIVEEILFINNAP